MRHLVRLRRGSSRSGNVVFLAVFRNKLTDVAKWTAESNNVPADVVNNHTRRAGGATALFAACVDWVAIQRRGARRPFILREYIRIDSAVFFRHRRKA